MAGRDRDSAGRPQSARPRDALGRPLPYGSEGVARIADDLRLSPAETIAYAQRLIDQDLTFHAHEVLEAAWKQRADSERALWQGLAQLAVGITHVHRGNVVGAAKLLRRAALRLDEYDAASDAERHGVDVAGLVGYARMLAVELGGTTAPAADRLRPRLAAAV